MTFMPSTWQESEHDANILRDNLENAVRQLSLEQRVITALRDQKESEETIQDPAGIASIVEKEEQEEGANEEDLLETIEEQSEERIDSAGDNADDTAAEETPEAAQIDDSNDCGTDVAGDDE